MIEVERNLFEQTFSPEESVAKHNSATPSSDEKTLTFVDLFAGIGGFHLAMHSVGAECVFASEWDKFARQTYEANFRPISPKLFREGHFAGDINKVDLEDIPSFDILCAGFPCQPFSNAGLRRGFEDTRGTLFFRIAEIVKHQIDKGVPPQVLFLENVKGLLHHDQNRTLKTICSVLDDLGYYVSYRVLNARNFGVPQNRERIFIIAWLKSSDIHAFKFPLGLSSTNEHIFSDVNLHRDVKDTKVGDILMNQVDAKYTLSERLYAGHLRRKEMHKQKGNGFGFSLFDANSKYTNTISARYYKDGSEILIAQDNNRPRKLHPKEAGRLQGFPIDNGFNIVVSDTQAYKQFGNSVAVPMVKSIAQEIVNQLIR